MQNCTSSVWEELITTYYVCAIPHKHLYRSISPHPCCIRSLFSEMMPFIWQVPYFTSYSVLNENNSLGLEVNLGKIICFWTISPDWSLRLDQHYIWFTDHSKCWNLVYKPLILCWDLWGWYYLRRTRISGLCLYSEHNTTPCLFVSFSCSRFPAFIALQME